MTETSGDYVSNHYDFYLRNSQPPKLSAEEMQSLSDAISGWPEPSSPDSLKDRLGVHHPSASERETFDDTVEFRVEEMHHSLADFRNRPEAKVTCFDCGNPVERATWYAPDFRRDPRVSLPPQVVVTAWPCRHQRGITVQLLLALGNE